MIIYSSPLKYLLIIIKLLINKRIFSSSYRIIIKSSLIREVSIMFQEKIKSFASRIPKMQENILTEEATKTSLVMPFFQIMGYDVFNPQEFTPEFTADVGIKKGEKVDYAILVDNKPVILIECKSINEKLEKHDSQLFRYFGTTTAKFAILTNGIIYRFYTDIEETNKMDEAPFLEIDLLNLKDYLISELTKFTKDQFDENEIFNSAGELRAMNQIRQIIKEEIQNPSDEFVRFVLNHGVYEGVKTQNVVEQYFPLVKKSFTLVLNEMINDRLKNALDDTPDTTKNESNISEIEGEPEIEDTESKIITTEDELDSFYIIKAILRKNIDVTRITYKDKETYFAINIDNKTTKWVCRLYIKERIKYIIIPNDNNNQRFDFESTDEIYKLEPQLQKRLSELI